MANFTNSAATLLAARGLVKQSSSIGDFISDNAGAILGGLAGLGGGSAIGANILDDDTLDENTRRSRKLRGGILGGITGALTGGIGGHLLHNAFGDGAAAAAPAAKPAAKPVETPQAEEAEEAAGPVTPPVVAVSTPVNEESAAAKPKAEKPRPLSRADRNKKLTQQEAIELANDMLDEYGENADAASIANANANLRASQQKENDNVKYNLIPYLDYLTQGKAHTIDDKGKFWDAFHFYTSDKGQQLVPQIDNFADALYGKLTGGNPQLEAILAPHKQEALRNAYADMAGVRVKESSFHKQAGSVSDFLADNAGAIIGALGGLGTGAIAGSELLDDDTLDSVERSSARLQGGLIGALAGGAIGGIGGHYLQGLVGDAFSDDTPGEPVSGNQGNNGVATGGKAAGGNAKSTQSAPSGPSLWDKVMGKAGRGWHRLAKAWRAADREEQDKDSIEVDITGTAVGAGAGVIGRKAYVNKVSLPKAVAARNAAAVARTNAKLNVSNIEATLRNPALSPEAIVAQRNALAQAKAALTEAESTLAAANAKVGKLGSWKTGAKSGLAGAALGFGISHNARRILNAWDHFFGNR